MRGSVDRQMFPSRDPRRRRLEPGGQPLIERLDLYNDAFGA